MEYDSRHIRTLVAQVHWPTNNFLGGFLLERWFPESASVVAREIDQLFWYSTAWTAGTGVVVIAILIFFLIRYRKKLGRVAYYTHGNTAKAISLTLGLATLVFLLLDLNLAYHDHLVWGSMFGRPPSAIESLRVQVMPEQFAWNIRYAGLDGEFRTADDIVTINEMHVPANKPVIVQLTSKDVVHSFFLPNLRIKQDAVPGMITSLYFIPERPGIYNIACAEHCGLGHYRMKGSFVIESGADFNAWMEAQAKENLDSDVSANSWGWDWNRGLVAGSGPLLKKENPS